MDVIVDGERNFRMEGNPKDVLSAVAAIGDSLRAKGRAILTVAADGKRMDSSETVHNIGGLAVSGVRVLEVHSGDVNTMVAESLQEMERVLPELPTACHSLAEIFQSSTPQHGYEPFQKLAEIWSHVKSRQLQVVNALHIPVNALRLNDKTFASLHEELNGYLEEAATALQAGDCVLLGDLLEYELAPRAELEAKIVALLQSHARGQTA